MNNKFHKGYYLLPNLMTTASLFAGFWGIMAATAGNFRTTAMAIFVSVFFDSLDGKLARLTNSSSDFGIQYDSLSDAIAFGVSPAIMMYLWVLKDYGHFGLGISFLLMACAVLRLARFNVQTGNIKTSKKYFVGIPAPGQAIILATFYFFTNIMPTWLIPISALCLTTLVALLMVSTVKYYSFKDFEIIKAYRHIATIILILIFVLITAHYQFFLFFFAFCYLLSGLIITFRGFSFTRSVKQIKEKIKHNRQYFHDPHDFED